MKIFGVVLLMAAIAGAQSNRPITIAYQVTHSVNVDPSFSPDGRMVFISVVSGKEQLFIAKVDGSEARQITHDDVDHEDPAWSPDGKKIAFVRVADDREQIFLMNPDGSDVEELTPKELRTIHPNWSPDGKLVAFCTNDDVKPPAKNNSDIYTIEVNGHALRKVITGGVNTYPAWSPDGRMFAFRRMLPENNSEVFTANADGSNIKNITNSPAFDGWPAWSPDGTKIAFASNRNASYEIYVMDPDGKNVQKVAASEGRATAPQWSRDGTMIYFPNCHKVDFGGDCQIYAARLGGIR